MAGRIWRALMALALALAGSCAMAQSDRKRCATLEQAYLQSGNEDVFDAWKACVTAATPATAMEFRAPVIGALGDDLDIMGGFLPVSRYRELPEHLRRFHVSGLINGMLAAPLLGAKKQQVAWLERCLVGKTDEFLTMKIDRWLDGHRMHWHLPMPLLAHGAMRDACGR